MVKFAECECRDCGQTFKIVFDNSYPRIIHCPKCSGILIKLHWIDRAGFNKILEECDDREDSM